LRKKSS